MKEIPLTRGMVALVDDEDYEEVMRYRWRSVQKRNGRTQYAMTNVRKEDGKRTTVEMQTIVLGKSLDGRHIDHINGNGLDNRRSNLRYATKSEQRRNGPPHRDNKTGFKGVTVAYTRTGAYRAELMTKTQRIQLGYFKSAEAAARAYDAKAREMYGEFARTNFAAE